MQKPRRFPVVGLLILFSLIPIELVYAVPAAPKIHVLVQPDKTTISARLWGDEWVNGWETVEGYTIVQDSKGYWVFAEKDLSGNLVPGATKANEFPPVRLEPHLRPSGAALQKAQRLWQQAPELVIPPTGTAALPVVLINVNGKGQGMTFDFNGYGA